jgi:elongation factor Ts
MQVTAAAPQYVSREEIPPAAVEEQRARIAADLGGTPAAALEGRLEKWFGEVALLDQPFIKDENRPIKDVITEAVARIGENIQVRRFARFRIGD